MQEAAAENFSAYSSFNQFFTRELKKDARPLVVGKENLCLPADGRISECGNIEENLLIQAKGHYFSLEDLLAGEKKLAKTHCNL